MTPLDANLFLAEAALSCLAEMDRDALPDVEENCSPRIHLVHARGALGAIVRQLVAVREQDESRRSRRGKGR